MAALGSLPSVALLMMMAWVAARTVPYLGTYGVDAARDSVIAAYGVFAFVVMALVLERPERLARAVASYGRFAWFYGLAGILIVHTGPVVSPILPDWPNSGVPALHVRLGEGATHLAGAVVFALVGLRRVSRFWVAVAACSVCMVSVSRGAMLACLLPIALAGLLMRRKGRFAAALLAAGLLLLAASAADVEVPLPGGRSIGPQQMVNGFESIIGTSSEANFDGTKRWRLNWWDSIIGYTVHGPYFWTGKGFGVNLAVADGFVVGQELAGPPVRSPHNAHMTMLARAGVPGLCLWIAVCATWFATVLRAMLVARRRGDHGWSDVFLWITCYGAAFVVNASFDVALEGPMLGIWFWCLYGFGVAAAMVYGTAISRPPAPAGAWALRRPRG